MPIPNDKKSTFRAMLNNPDNAYLKAVYDTMPSKISAEADKSVMIDYEAGCRMIALHLSDDSVVSYEVDIMPGELKKHFRDGGKLAALESAVGANPAAASLVDVMNGSESSIPMRVRSSAILALLDGLPVTVVDLANETDALFMNAAKGLGDRARSIAVENGLPATLYMRDIKGAL
jgi:hypothetical protein